MLISIFLSVIDKGSSVPVYLPLVDLHDIHCAWNVYVFGVFQFRVFPHSDKMRRFNLRIQSKRGKIQTRKAPTAATFYALITT